MAHTGKGISTKPDSVSSIPGAHMTGENLGKLSSRLHARTMACAHTHIDMRRHRMKIKLLDVSL